MANAYVEELRNLTKGLALTEASKRRLFFEEQLKQAKDDLTAAEVGLKQAQQKSGMIQLDAQAKSIIDTVGNLRARIAAKKVDLQGMRSFATAQNAHVALPDRHLTQIPAQPMRL